MENKKEIIDVVDNDKKETIAVVDNDKKETIAVVDNEIIEDTETHIFNVLNIATDDVNMLKAMHKKYEKRLFIKIPFYYLNEKDVEIQELGRDVVDFNMLVWGTQSIKEPGKDAVIGPVPEFIINSSAKFRDVKTFPLMTMGGDHFGHIGGHNIAMKYFNTGNSPFRVTYDTESPYMVFQFRNKHPTIIHYFLKMIEKDENGNNILQAYNKILDTVSQKKTMDKDEFLNKVINDEKIRGEVMRTLEKVEEEDVAQRKKEEDESQKKKDNIPKKNKPGKKKKKQGRNRRGGKRRR